MSTIASHDAGPLLTASFAGLVDDAAIFPPGNAPMPDAVRQHSHHRASWYAPLVGGFVCADTRLTELQSALDESGDDSSEHPLHVTLTINGGAGAIEPAVTWVGRDSRLRLTGVEVALRDEDDLAHNAARMTTVLRDCLPADASASVEMPRLYGTDVPRGWGAALDEVAAGGYQAKFRTGGPDHDAFPGAEELVVLLTTCLDRETPFKCTAGLHNAVRHTAPDTGFEHHGFLNVLLATRAILDGVSPADVASTLEQRSGTDVARRVRALGDEGTASTRRWFTSVGSCSVDEPVQDLLDLGLVSEGGTA